MPLVGFEPKISAGERPDISSLRVIISCKSLTYCCHSVKITKRDPTKLSFSFSYYLLTENRSFFGNRHFSNGHAGNSHAMLFPSHHTRKHSNSIPSIYGSTAPSGSWPPSQDASIHLYSQLFSSILLSPAVVVHPSEPHPPI